MSVKSICSCGAWTLLKIGHISSSFADADQHKEGERSIDFPMHWQEFLDLNIMSHTISGGISITNDVNIFALEGRHDYHQNHELIGLYTRQFGEELSGYIGYEITQEKIAPDLTETEGIALLGVLYRLPFENKYFQIEADVRIDETSHINLTLNSEIEIIDRLTFDWEINTDEEYEIGLSYEITDHIALTFYRGTKFGTGIGVGFSF